MYHECIGLPFMSHRCSGWYSGAASALSDHVGSIGVLGGVSGATSVLGGLSCARFAMLPGRSAQHSWTPSGSRVMERVRNGCGTDTERVMERVRNGYGTGTERVRNGLWNGYGTGAERVRNGLWNGDSVLNIFCKQILAETLLTVGNKSHAPGLMWFEFQVLMFDVRC